MSESIIRAVRVNPKTQEAVKIEAADITDDTKGNYHYYCADCYEKGHYVRLKYVKASERKVTFEKWDKVSEDLALNESGATITKEKKYHFPAHFDRWPEATPHRCDQIVRYAAFRSSALYVNGVATGPHSYIFPISLPGQGGWNDHDGKNPTDLRASFRPAGMGLGGIQNADALKKLITHFETDPGLQHFQHFHDGYKIRAFKETFFESPLAVYEYLKKEKAFGRGNAVVVAYLLNPNTSSFAVKNHLHGFVDRSNPKLDDGEKLELFVRGMNRPAEKLLSDMGRRHGLFQNAPILVLGEARIDDNNDHHVEIEFYNPKQITEWDSEMRFLPKFNPALTAQISLEL